MCNNGSMLGSIMLNGYYSTIRICRCTLNRVLYTKKRQLGKGESYKGKEKIERHVPIPGSLVKLILIFQFLAVFQRLIDRSV